MQADPTQAGMWKSVVTQDGQMGVTVPAGSREEQSVCVYVCACVCACACV